MVEFSYLNPPRRERERLDLILYQLSERLKHMVEASTQLSETSLASRTRFLGEFPKPLREGLDERVMYGSLGKPGRFNIYDNDFSSRRAEMAVPQGSLKASPIHF